MKKANITITFSFFTLLILGFVISLHIDKPWISFLIVILTGFMSGKIISERKRNLMFPVTLISLGFILGYITGNKTSNGIILIILFIISIISGYTAKKYLKHKF